MKKSPEIKELEARLKQINAEIRSLQKQAAEQQAQQLIQKGREIDGQIADYRDGVSSLIQEPVGKKEYRAALRLYKWEKKGIPRYSTWWWINVAASPLKLVGITIRAAWMSAKTGALIIGGAVLVTGGKEYADSPQSVKNNLKDVAGMTVSVSEQQQALSEKKAPITGQMAQTAMGVRAYLKEVSQEAEESIDVSPKKVPVSSEQPVFGQRTVERRSR